MPKPFKLQPLLAHKKRLEELQQLRLAKIREEHTRQSGTLHDLVEHRERQIDSLASERGGVLDAADVQRRLAYIERVREGVAKQGEVVGHLETEVEQNRHELVGILKEKQILERLRDNELEQAAAAAKWREAQVTDEISMTRFVRDQRKETGT